MNIEGSLALNIVLNFTSLAMMSAYLECHQLPSLAAPHVWGRSRAGGESAKSERRPKRKSKAERAKGRRTMPGYAWRMERLRVRHVE
jgi:hypothetical protein